MSNFYFNRKCCARRDLLRTIYISTIENRNSCPVFRTRQLGNFGLVRYCKIYFNIYHQKSRICKVNPLCPPNWLIEEMEKLIEELTHFKSTFYENKRMSIWNMPCEIIHDFILPKIIDKCRNIVLDSDFWKNCLQ